MDKGPFSTIEVSPDDRTTRRLSWEIRDAVTAPDPGVNIYKRRVGGDWVLMNPDAPISRAMFWVDGDETMKGLREDREYRLELIPDLSDTGTSLYSGAFPETGLFTKEGFMIVRTLLDNDRKLLKKSFGGVEGVLYPKRVHGPSCTTCSDPYLDGGSSDTCPDCYGTGIEGGYLPGIEMYMRYLQRGPRQIQTREPLGAAGDEKVSMTRPAFPRLHSGDLWVAAGTGRIHEVLVLAPGAVVEGNPVLYKQITMERLPYGRPIYDLLGEGTMYTPDQDIEHIQVVYNLEWEQTDW